jgi:hypothetical protein
MRFFSYILRHWLRWGRRLPRPERALVPRRRPAFEGLEDRNLLSATPALGALIPRAMVGAENYLVRVQLGPEPLVQISTDGGATFTNFAPSGGWDPSTEWAVAGGNGSFSSQQAVPGTGSGPESLLLAEGDFAGEGSAGVALAFQGRVSILLPQPDGSYETALSYVPGNQTPVIFLAAGDFNGEGHTDLAAVTRAPGQAGSELNVLLGQGNGTFQTQVNLTTGAGVYAVSVGTSSSEASLTVGDLSRNGVPDLLLTRHDSGGQGTTTSVLLSNSDGSYQAPEELRSATGPASVAISDWNGSGTPQVKLVSSLPPVAPSAAPAPLEMAAADSSAAPVAFTPTVEGASLPVQVLVLPGDSSASPSGAPADTQTGAASASPAAPDFTIEVRVDAAGDGNFVALAPHSADGQSAPVTSLPGTRGPSNDPAAPATPATALPASTSAPAVEKKDSAPEPGITPSPDLPEAVALGMPASYELVVVRGDVLQVDAGTLETANAAGGESAAANPAVPLSASEDREAAPAAPASPVEAAGATAALPEPNPAQPAGDLAAERLDLSAQLAAPLLADVAVPRLEGQGRDGRGRGALLPAAGADPRDGGLSLLDVGQLLAQAFYLAKLKSAAAPAEASAAPALVQTAGDAGLQVAEVVQESAAAFTELVRSFYARFLGRQPVNGEEQGWVHMLLSGQTEEQVLSAFLTAAEFGKRTMDLSASGAPDARFVQALYLLLLVRAATDEEVSSWLRGLSGLGRRGVALALLRSAEYRKRQIETFFREQLGREGSAAAVDAWAASPFDLLSLRGFFVSRPELFAEA